MSVMFYSSVKKRHVVLFLEPNNACCTHHGVHGASYLLSAIFVELF